MKLKLVFSVIKWFIFIIFIVMLFGNLSNIFNSAYDYFNKGIDDKYIKKISEFYTKVNEINSKAQIVYVEENNSLNRTALGNTLSESIDGLSEIATELEEMPVNERYKDSQKNLLDAILKNIDLYNTMQFLFRDTYTEESAAELLKIKNDLIFLYQQCKFKSIQFSLLNNVDTFVDTFIDEMNKEKR